MTHIPSYLKHNITSLDSSTPHVLSNSPFGQGLLKIKLLERIFEQLKQTPREEFEFSGVLALMGPTSQTVVTAEKSRRPHFHSCHTKSISCWLCYSHNYYTGSKIF
ncbi:hypothetical protein DSO57_1004969 [Entomophthora muscae]|uniref:Uncharacterized protein n=1 Tax=Entomophthora muscae TaxID=34485 RepID=A0ACC2U6D9_9FUNG|nr:hypothetical protein DSO57_1004969 [Entomophthora muscae]